MSSRTPWHKHPFSPGTNTKKSCIVCSGTEDAPQHQLEEAPVEQKVEVKEEPQVIMCWKCNKKPGRRLPQNGAVLCSECETILKP